MNDLAIRVENLGKQYRIGAKQQSYETLRESLVDAAATPVRRLVGAIRGRMPGRTETSIWALRNVSVEVNRGEVVGIIGRNGAGKTTMLKILSRITTPTKGSVDLWGRVGSLLEVGTGFHPELTGRENIYLNGAILGMRRTEIQRRFDEIVEFAEVARFLDTPVKRYSSGMYVRLAFSVAAHFEPDILLVDEVLAVGDAEFQRKCLAKMEDDSTQGRTVILVSHNTGAIKSLCSRVIVLDRGEIVFNGNPLLAVAKYAGIDQNQLASIRWELSKRPSTANVELVEVGILSASRKVGTDISTEVPSQIYIDFFVKRDKAVVGTSVLIHTLDGQLLFVSMSNREPNWHLKERPSGTYRSMCEIPENLLAEGQYSVSIALWENFYAAGVVENDVLRFNAHEQGFVRGDYPREQKGHLIQPLLKWSSVRTDSNLPKDSKIP